jgi:hypothetical protein
MKTITSAFVAALPLAGPAGAARACDSKTFHAGVARDRN